MPDQAKLLKLAKERFEQAQTAEHDQRVRELEDLKFYAGEQWPQDILNIRQGQTLNQNLPPVPARPTLTINLTREPVRQVLNAERQSDIGIELIPADDFGGLTQPIDHSEIEVREGLVRRIQRDSEAADARTWAFARAAIAGRGYYGVMTRYAPGKTADQEIFIQRFYNQSSVTLDPTHEQPDGSDAEWAFVGIDMPWDQYKAEFPSTREKPNRVSSGTTTDSDFRNLGEDAPGWFTTEGDTKSCRVVDYYYTERESKPLAMFQNGTALWVEELLPEAVKVSEFAPDSPPTAYTTRTVTTKSIKWCKIDGVQVLDETDWPGHYIPIVKVVGEELQPYDQHRRYEGMVRPARDSCRSYNYMVSKWVELIGLTPIPPWLMAAGQDEKFEEEWMASNVRTLPVLHYNNQDVNGQPVGPPVRTSVQVDIGAIASSVALFKEAVTDTMGVPPPALGHVDPTLKSGKAIQAVLQQAERGTSNYLDNLTRSMRHEARVVNDLLFPIYGRPGRLARLMNPQGEMSTVTMGTAAMGRGVTLTKDAEWNVAVKVTKNYDTRRQQEAAIVGDIISADPSQMAIVGDIFMQNLDGPGHDQMAERYKVMLAPPIQAMLRGQTPLPPEAQQQMQQMQQQIQQLTQLADKNVTDLKKAQLGADADVQKARVDGDVRIRVAGIQAEASVAGAEIKAGMDDLALRLDHMETLIGVQHEAGTQARDHAHELQMAQMGHQQALEQGDQGHQQALEQGAQQAALEPEPEPTEAGA